MATGACGINCQTCRLHLRGECGSCGPAMSQLAGLKLQTQERLLGAPCPLLACARMNNINHCMADCDSFPCENFTRSPYPFSKAFLEMQQRRREEMDRRHSLHDNVNIAMEHWQKLGNRKKETLQYAAGTRFGNAGQIELTVFNARVSVFIEKRLVQILREGKWLKAPPIMALVVVMYLITAVPVPITGKWATEKELSCASFFRGIHELPIRAITDHFGAAALKFLAAGEKLGATRAVDDGDCALLLWVLPRVPVKMILWCRDDELPATITVLFDESIEQLLPADAIWMMVHLLQDEMLGVVHS